MTNERQALQALLTNFDRAPLADTDAAMAVYRAIEGAARRQRIPDTTAEGARAF